MVLDFNVCVAAGVLCNLTCTASPAPRPALFAILFWIFHLSLIAQYQFIMSCFT